MDLKLIGATATPTELEALAAVEGVGAGPPVDGSDDRVVRSDRTRRHLLLPALAAVQSAVGHISPGAIDAIAVRLDVPPADIHAVASFYALLSTTPRPDRVAHICDDVACRAAGASDLIDRLADRPDVVSSPCLGQCDRRPAVFVQRTGQADLVLTGEESGRVEEALDQGWEPDPVPAGSSLPGTGERRVLARIARYDPTELESYRAAGGYRALGAAVEMGPEAVIAALETSGLKGRGGAAFPTGFKWRGVRDAPPGRRYVICNADESEPGTFKDRVLMEGDPFGVIETLTIAGWTVGAETGYVYIRGEYPLATRLLRGAIEQARQAGLLGDDLMGTGRRFDIEIRRGQGAYICGEETALMNSIEGWRGEPRQKPPFPTVAGLFGMPTVVNNVETLLNLFDVLDDPVGYAVRGTAESTGTRLFCLSGDVGRPGVYEVEFGATLGELLAMAGADPAAIGAVLLGGAAGSLVGPESYALPLTFEATREAGVSLGSGVVMAFGHHVDLRDVVLRIARFFRDESCGQCVPCRVGTVRVEEAVARSGGTVEAGLIDELDRAMKDASICGLGHTAASVVRSAIRLGVLGEPV